MSHECQAELESTVTQRWDVDVMTGKANLEVRPTFINKGEIAKRLVNSYNSETADITAGPGKVGFVLCMGDDFTDEDMFRALNGLSTHVAGTEAGTEAETEVGGSVTLDSQQCFTVTVGASTKVTLARWHLLEPEDVVECVALLAGVGSGGGGASSGGVLSMGEVNLGALSAVEGHIPK
jgi:trehalose 6-phosphate synthase/phosphatase